MVRRAALVVLLMVVLSGCDVGLWKFNERSGSTAIDTAGGDNNGRSSNVGLGEPGVEGFAYRFNGFSSIVRVPHSSKLNPGSKGFSYGASVKFLGVPPPQTWDVIRKGLNSEGDYYKLELQNIDGTARARCYMEGTSGSESIIGSTPVNDGRWHQITCSRRNGRVSLTIDDRVRTETGDPGFIANGSQLTIGAKSTGDDYFAGLIDLPRVSVD
jgi:hypothetical protein